MMTRPTSIVVCCAANMVTCIVQGSSTIIQDSTTESDRNDSTAPLSSTDPPTQSDVSALLMAAYNVAVLLIVVIPVVTCLCCYCRVLCSSGVSLGRRKAPRMPDESPNGAGNASSAVENSVTDGSALGREDAVQHEGAAVVGLVVSDQERSSTETGQHSRPAQSRAVCNISTASNAGDDRKTADYHDYANCPPLRAAAAAKDETMTLRAYENWQVFAAFQRSSRSLRSMFLSRASRDYSKQLTSQKPVKGRASGGGCLHEGSDLDHDDYVDMASKPMKNGMLSRLRIEGALNIDSRFMPTERKVLACENHAFPPTVLNQNASIEKVYK